MRNNNQNTEKSPPQNSSAQQSRLGTYPSLTLAFFSTPTSSSSSRAMLPPPPVKPITYQEKNRHGTRPATRTERENLRPASSSLIDGSNQAIPTAILNKFSKKNYYLIGQKSFISHDSCILNQDNVPEKENALKNAAEAFDLSSKRPFLS